MNRVVKNYIYNLSYQILVLVVPLITTPYISRVLGAKGVGTFSYTNSIVQYFILFGCVGLNLYGQREIAYVQNEKENRDKLFWEIVLMKIVMGIISVMIFYYTFAIKGKYASVFSIMCLDIFASIVDISWFFQGIEDFKKITIRNFIIKIVGVILIYVFVKESDDLLIYVFCQSAVLWVGNLSMWGYVPKLVGRIKKSEIRIKKHIKPTMLLFLPQIAISVYTVLDKTMIGFLTGIEEEVAYYEQGQKIVRIVMTFVTSLSTVMMPRVANLFKKNEMNMVRSYLLKSFKFTFSLSFPMMFGVMGVSYNLVPWFFGSGYEKVIPNMIAISPILVIIAFSNLIGNQFLLPIRRQKEYTLSVIVGCIVNFVMNILLIPQFLSIGAAVATVVAEMSVTGIQVIFTRKDFNYVEILISNYHYILFSILMFIPTHLLARYLPANIVNTFICIVVGSMIYLGLLLGVKDEIIYEMVRNVKVKRSKGIQNKVNRR